MVLRKSAIFILAVAATSVMSIETSYAATVPLNSQITLTKSQVQQGQSRQADLNQKYGAIALGQSPKVSTSNAIIPNYVPGGPPYSASAPVGNMNESDSGSTCGPISAWNLLDGELGSNTPSLSTLESQLGWTQGGGTNLGSNWTSTLNSDQSYYTYSVMPNPTPSDVFVDTATIVGLSDIGNIDNIYGYLPGYKSVWYLGYTYHYVTGYAYSGYGYGTASSQDVTWYDESDINSYGHHITNSVATLQGLEGSSQPGLNFQGVIS
ncbi:hypothetical protein [Sulfoacidibacillus thermotolerans]|uniref:Peptidase C39-like domain-containing protein n=1 Tax=Sulfoacidibacillus thermotolerans TaxID=1765684 RepID=A0A2U3D729_SULT2|nr:hypothetical protein [Sulfoacidibacillus thermotolerans]PWI57089.1 hypothetical protein BM613_10595 [Sulfoacidibacillus thermotolerans]